MTPIGIKNREVTDIRRGAGFSGIGFVDERNAAALLGRFDGRKQPGKTAAYDEYVDLGVIFFGHARFQIPIQNRTLGEWGRIGIDLRQCNKAIWNLR